MVDKTLLMQKAEAKSLLVIDEAFVKRLAAGDLKVCKYRVKPYAGVEPPYVGTIVKINSAYYQVVDINFFVDDVSYDVSLVKVVR